MIATFEFEAFEIRACRNVRKAVTVKIDGRYVVVLPDNYVSGWAPVPFGLVAVGYIEAKLQVSTFSSPGSMTATTS